MFQAQWLRSRPWLVFLAGLLLEAAATIPFGVLDLSAVEASAALAILVGVAVALLAGPRWGALVSAAGWALYFTLVSDQAARVIVALPVWLAAAIVAGLASERLRRLDRDRRRLTSELEAVREDPSQAIVGLDLEGNIVGWDRGAERIYGHAAEEVEGSNVTILSPGDEGRHLLEALERVGGGERVDRDHLRHRRKN